MKIELEVDERLVLPQQNLEGKHAFVAKITEVFGCDENGECNNRSVYTSDYVRVQISNRSGILNGVSSQIYDRETFEKFKRSYRLEDPEDLIGRTAISVYGGSFLSGLIPLNMDR